MSFNVLSIDWFFSTVVFLVVLFLSAVCTSNGDLTTHPTFYINSYLVAGEAERV